MYLLSTKLIQRVLCPWTAILAQRGVLWLVGLVFPAHGRTHDQGLSLQQWIAGMTSGCETAAAAAGQTKPRNKSSVRNREVQNLKKAGQTKPWNHKSNF